MTWGDRMDAREFLLNKNLWIYGIGKLQKDFQYIFNETHILGYIDDVFQQKTWSEKKIYSLDAFIKNKWEKNSGCIICSYQKEQVAGLLEKKSMLYRKDYFFVEDFFSLLDYPINEKSAGRPIVFWGAGKNAERLLDKYQNKLSVEFFLDNNINKKNTTIAACQIKHPENMNKEDWEKYFIVVTSVHYFSIKRQLEMLGLKEGRDFISFSLLEPVSALLTKTYYDTDCYEVECHSMLSHLDIAPHGTVHSCCATFLDAPMGNLVAQDIADIWQSKRHRVFCLSALNHTFSFCKKDLCPVLINRKKKKYVEKYEKSCYAEPKVHPEAVNIAVDFSCNLYCETCRKELKVAKGADKEEIDLLADKILEQVMPFTEFVMLAGNGEVFLSKAYEKIWSSSKGKSCKYLQILSNGTLFTQAKWEKMMNGRSSDILFCVSIDAAMEETYHKLRRGGDWSALLKNMEFAAKLRQEGEIKYFRMNFVVQQENYKEIPAFIEWGKKLHADRILFTRILNWGTYTDETFEKISMVDKNGKPKQALQEILNLPICQESIVDVGTFEWKHNYEDAQFIDNYYMWEIRNYLTDKKYKID